MKWADVISILSLALSGGIFLLLGTGLTSAKDSASTPITVIDNNGGRLLLDTLLPIGEVGLIVIVENRETRDNIVADDTVSTKSTKTTKTTKSPAASKSQSTPKPALSIPIESELPCVNINDADEAALTAIKGIGPATAAQIMEYRAQKGYFQKKEDILKVKGIGPAKFAQIEGQICF